MIRSRLYCLQSCQIWQTFPIEIRDSISLKNFKHKIKTWHYSSCPCYCCKPYVRHLWVYLNVIITSYIFSDGFIYANILEDFNIPNFGVNEA